MARSATGYAIDQQEYERQLRMHQDQYYHDLYYQQRPPQSYGTSGTQGMTGSCCIGDSAGTPGGYVSLEEKERVEKEKKLKKLIAYYYGRRK